jgi:hypothetical protein
MEKLLAIVVKIAMTQVQKQFNFHPSKDPITILDEKCAFSFYLPFVHVIVTN